MNLEASMAMHCHLHVPQEETSQHPIYMQNGIGMSEICQPEKNIINMVKCIESNQLNVIIISYNNTMCGLFYNTRLHGVEWRMINE
jgi:hypothetical protein